MSKTSSYELIRIIGLVKENIHSQMKNYFKHYDLTGPQSMIISIIAKEGRQKVSYFSKKMGLSNSTVSGIIDRLEAQHYVIRERDSKDRRVVYVDLHQDIKESVESHKLNFQNYWDCLMNQASKEEQASVIEGLKTLELLMERVKTANEE